MGLVNIIKPLTYFVNPFFRSKFFWLVVGSVFLLLVLTKFNFSTVVKIIKLLGKLAVSVGHIFLYLALSPFIKVFQEAEEM
ncbi:hypothetical protein ES703_59923 [subsurface metagenome]